jgi:hypothetical protein
MKRTRETINLFRSRKKRIKKVLESDDLDEVRRTGIAERDLKEIVERMALGEVMAKFLGTEKAIEIRTSLSEEIAHIFFPKIFLTKEFLRQYMHQTNKTKRTNIRRMESL